MSLLSEFRQQKDEFFKHDWQSPLTPEQQKEFNGLKYFPENPALSLTVKVQEHETKPVVTMMTSTGSAREYLQYGQFTFDVNGEAATLHIYQDANDGYFFLPFVDATAPDETYGAGRYLDLEPGDDGTYIIDFNYAYNPYCAYDDRWSCPIPPGENRLKVRIEAGEKNYYENH